MNIYVFKTFNIWQKQNKKNIWNQLCILIGLKMDFGFENMNTCSYMI